MARRARTASQTLRGTTSTDKSAILRAIAASLEANVSAIIAANERDMAQGREAGLSDALLDRLLLSEDRINAIADAARHVATLPDPIGEVVRGTTLPNGLRIRQVRVPMGVIGMIYEARPNVTVDAAALALKAGSAVILRGGHAAAQTNEVLVDLMRNAVADAGLDADSVQTIDQFGREGSVALMRARGLVDLVIPRGGSGLIQTVVRESLVPVIETGVGNCHVYVDRAAALDKALAITINAKTHRPGVCNAAESLLVHRDVAAEFLPQALRELAARDVVLHGCEATVRLAPDDVVVNPAMEEDWATEYLGLEMAVRVVETEEEAVDHIRRYSTGHTEAIISQDVEAIRYFTDAIDGAAIMINASTRFTDGGELGLGAEIGISTQKLHARGPMGLSELTTTTWIVEGDGHVRS
ncbi:glutamate-5-semialdehyde dehydrogenase [Actinobaculum sp. 313]|uniref:glutamate-5-semialdehyde dehydrogenase n=1 Tax=Actinobaculum sp. 313 TaxID=2495645 RepID=UPI001F0CDD15|nr:glutamate-5-semialdehyde dehydrogenase [Actinobaculum sp. 313]